MKFGYHRVLTTVAAICALTAILGGLWFFRPWIYEALQLQPSLDSITAYRDVRWTDLRKLDLRPNLDLLPTLRFNQKTRWPNRDQLPSKFNPGEFLTNAMNPGLRIRDLHRAGITGRGVSVAIIDYSIEGEHPEYSGRVAEIHRVRNAAGPSMHGPAVASLLVGASCGTAPEAKLYFVVVPDATTDATHYAEALDWVVAKNATLAPSEKIRIVSVSASPSGRGVWPFRHGELWDAAYQRAEEAGLLVIDGTEHHGFVGPCNLDPRNPEDPAKCRPVPARNKPSYFDGRVLAPTAPRSTAEEYRRGDRGYQYCGLQKETLLAAGSSWSMPYCAGVLALGMQIRPELSPAKFKHLLFNSAFALVDGKKIIDPNAFIKAVRAARSPELEKPPQNE